MNLASSQTNQLIELPAQDCCQAAQRARFRYCPHCGKPLTPDSQAAAVETTIIVAPDAPTSLAEPAATGPKIRQMLDNRLVIVGLLLCGGPMALPAMWFSRSFSTTTKTLTTIGYTLLTVVMPIAVTWYFMNAALWPLLEAFKR